MFLGKFRMPFMEEADDKGGNIDEIVLDESVEEVVEEPKEEPKEDKVPLATLLDEKRKRKELERQLREYKEKEVDTDAKLTKTQLRQKYIDKGFDEDVAESLADEFTSLRMEVRKAQFKELEPIDEDLKELTRDSFYSDALTYKKEIQSVITDFKKKGIDLDLEEAYLKVRGKARLKEYKTEIEQKALLDRRNADDKKLPASTSKPVKDPYPLDETDKAALAGLQKAQPNSAWNAEKFYKLMKG